MELLPLITPLLQVESPVYLGGNVQHRNSKLLSPLCNFPPSNVPVENASLFLLPSPATAYSSSSRACTPKSRHFFLHCSSIHPDAPNPSSQPSFTDAVIIHLSSGSKLISPYVANPNHFRSPSHQALDNKTTSFSCQFSRFNSESRLILVHLYQQGTG